MSIAVIVESPSKCKTIESYLGKGYKCIATCGHVCELNTSKGIDPSMKPHYKYKPNARELKDKVKLFKEIILATDDDREGEGIAYHVCRLLGLPLTTPRIRFNEITKNALQYSIQHPDVLDMNWVQSQQARQLMDFHTGFMVSPFLWKHIAPRLSAGRCQTPCLRMVYDHKITDDKISYETTGYFTSMNIPFVYEKLHDITEIESFLDEVPKQKYTILVDPIIQKSYSPPLPLNTVQLQQISGMNPTVTMEIAQSLYEKGHITYMRTDSKTYSDTFMSQLRQHIDKEYGDKYIGPLLSVGDGHHAGTHEAIRPTSLVNPRLEGEEKKLYDKIYQHTLESGMSPCIVDVLHASINGFHFRCEDIKFQGWKIFQKHTPDSRFTFLRTVKQGHIDYQKVISRIHVSRCSLLTESSLIQKLESYCIGRPSTYASILKKIQDKGYVKMDIRPSVSLSLPEYTLEKGLDRTKRIVEREFGSNKKSLFIEPLGKQVIEFLEHMSIFSYDFTSKMEFNLDHISKGEMKWIDVCKEGYDMLCKETGTIQVPQIQIDDQHVYYEGRHVIESKDGTIHKVRDDVTLEEIKTSKVEDLIAPRGRLLGIYESKELYITKGKYGLYVIWGENTRSLKHISISYEHTLTYDYVVERLQTVLREMENGISVRKGKLGPYLFVPGKKKPKFISLKEFKGDYLTCEESELLTYGKL